MPDSSQIQHEQAWRLLVLELFRAQEAYLRAMKGLGGTVAISQAWDRLQKALRLRDEFLDADCERHVEPQSRRA